MLVRDLADLTQLREGVEGACLRRLRHTDHAPPPTAGRRRRLAALVEAASSTAASWSRSISPWSPPTGTTIASLAHAARYQLRCHHSLTVSPDTAADTAAVRSGALLGGTAWRSCGATVALTV